MALNKNMLRVLKEVLELHDRKNTDYAGGKGEFFNFEFAANFAGISMNQGFRYIIGIKLARLIVLFSKETEPLNESIDDTILDSGIYHLIWKAWRNSERPSNDE